MRCLMLNLLYATRGVHPRPWMGGKVLWMGTPFMDISPSRVQHSPSVYFISFSSPCPLFQYYWPPHPSSDVSSFWGINESRISILLRGSSW